MSMLGKSRREKDGRVLCCCPAEEDRTRQSDKAQQDINRMMKRYSDVGLLPPGQAVPTGYYADFGKPVDLLEAHRVIKSAEEQFNSLPARARARFGNSPLGLLEFVADKRNLKEARELGLLREETPEPPPVKVEVINVPPPAAPPVKP